MQKASQLSAAPFQAGGAQKPLYNQAAKSHLLRKPGTLRFPRNPACPQERRHAGTGQEKPTFQMWILAASTVIHHGTHWKGQQGLLQVVGNQEAKLETHA
ncbi:hypothetical protein H1C71_039410 [Ictidomys tridecemlineatus]|nr:hypothetical protein H1C71_039410 [Ictidomys tridecemlineatus]